MLINRSTKINYTPELHETRFKRLSNHQANSNQHLSIRTLHASSYVQVPEALEVVGRQVLGVKGGRVLAVASLDRCVLLDPTILDAVVVVLEGFIEVLGVLLHLVDYVISDRIR